LLVSTQRRKGAELFCLNTETQRLHLKFHGNFDGRKAAITEDRIISQNKSLTDHERFVLAV